MFNKIFFEIYIVNPFIYFSKYDKKSETFDKNKTFD